MLYHEEIASVYQRISPYIVNTPVLYSSYFSQLTDSQIFYKCENLQFTNSFKARGVFSKLTQLKDKSHKTLIATSGGNHGMAVAYAAKKFNLKAIVIVPNFVPKYRIEKIKDLGAEVIIDGATMDELNEKAATFTQDPNCIYVHPFSDDDVIAGQATVAYELMHQIPDIEVIIVSIGGGGLISGIAQYAKSINPNVLIYGVQTIGADAMFQSLKADAVISIPAITSIAISLGATRVTEKTFNIVKQTVDHVVTVSDDEAIVEMTRILDHDKLLVEPATSCSLAAIVTNKIPHLRGKKIAVILCGGNISMQQLSNYIETT